MTVRPVSFPPRPASVSLYRGPLQPMYGIAPEYFARVPWTSDKLTRLELLGVMPAEANHEYVGYRL